MRLLVLSASSAVSVVLVLVIVALWAIGYGTEGSRHPDWYATHDDGLLRYYSVSTTSRGDGTVERRSTVHGWRLAATILLTGVSLGAIGAVWVLARRSLARALPNKPLQPTSGGHAKGRGGSMGTAARG